MIDESSTSFKITFGIIIVLLFAVLAAVVYSLLKPPVVTQDTINQLVQSTKNTQIYIKELRDFAYANQKATMEDNKLLVDTGQTRKEDYTDLRTKYGIVEYESRKNFTETVDNHRFTPLSGMHSETKDIRRQ